MFSKISAVSFYLTKMQQPDCKTPPFLKSLLPENNFFIHLYIKSTTSENQSYPPCVLPKKGYNCQM